jgi:hypothetical protein
MIRNITGRAAAIALATVFALSSFAYAAPKHERDSKRIEVFGRVLKIDKQARTFLVNDYWTKKLYLVNVPENATFKITFGQYMRLSQPAFGNVSKRDQVRMLCRYNDNEHLARMDDGRQAIVLTIAN